MPRSTWPWLADRNGNGAPLTDRERLYVFKEMVENASMMRSDLLNQLFDPRRSIEDECGYPTTDSITPDAYRQLYDHEPLATRTVQLMPRECWQRSPLVYETEDEEVTDFEQAWDDLGSQLVGEMGWYRDEKGSSIWEYLRRADELSGIGHFGIILLGIDDGRNLQDPIDGVVTVNTQGIGDCFMTPEEEKVICNGGLPSRGWRGKYERIGVPGGRSKLEPVVEDVPPRPLTTNEREIVGQWATGRQRVQEARGRHRAAMIGRAPEPPELLTANEARAIDRHARMIVNRPQMPPSKQPTGKARTSDGKVFPQGTDYAPSSAVPSPFLQGTDLQEPRSPADVLGYSQAFGLGAGTSPTQSNPGGSQGSAFSGPYSSQTPGAADQVRQGQSGDGTGGNFGGSIGYPPTGSDGAAQGTGGQGQPAPGSSLAGTDQQYFGVQYGPSEAFAPQPASAKHKLLFLRVFDESLVQIVRYEWNVRNPRFGLPVMYRVTLNDPREQHSGVGLPLATVFVHWSRVIHLADNLGNSEIFGVPRMRPVLYPLLDVKKVRGGSAEGYWRAGCTPVYSLETHPQLGGDVEVNPQALQDMMENVQNGLQKWMTLMGMSAKTLPPAVIDPTPYVAVQMESVCVQLQCPVRVFKGAERGELASSQDDEDWNLRVDARRNLYLTPRVICPFIDRLIQCGILPPPKAKQVKPQSPKLPAGTGAPAAGGSPKPGGSPSGSPPGGSPKPPGGSPPGQPPAGNRRLSVNASSSLQKDDERPGYSVEWPDPEAISDKDRAALCLQNTQAAAAYVQGNLESFITPHKFLTSDKFLGMDDEEATSCLEDAQQAHEDEETMTAPPMIGGRPTEAPEGTQEAADAQQAADQFKQTLEAKKSGAIADPAAAKGDAKIASAAKSQAKATQPELQ